jgi:hypothetical protein
MWIVAIVVVVVCAISVPVLLKVSDLAKHAGSLQAPLLSLISFLQSAHLFSSLDLAWPPEFLEFVHKVASVFNFSLPDWRYVPHPECSFTIDYTTKWFVMVLSPLELVLVLSVTVLTRFFLMSGIVRPCKKLLHQCWWKMKIARRRCREGDFVDNGSVQRFELGGQSDVNSPLSEQIDESGELDLDISFHQKTYSLFVMATEPLVSLPQKIVIVASTAAELRQACQDSLGLQCVVDIWHRDASSTASWRVTDQTLCDLPLRARVHLSPREQKEISDETSVQRDITPTPAMDGLARESHFEGAIPDSHDQLLCRTCAVVQQLRNGCAGLVSRLAR